MSKPLELVIYPHSRKHLNTNWLTFYETPEGLMAAGQSGVLPAAKHLSDAELAAEYWAQVHDSQYAMTCELAAEDKPGRKAARHWGAQSTARATTLHRFATSPHYFEAGQ